MAKSDKADKGKGAKHGKHRRGLAEALERSPTHLLQRAGQIAADAYAREAGAGAITQRQYAVLAAVEGAQGHEKGPPSQSDLVRLTGIDRSTLADMAARMLTKGLLERARSETDARANVVRLSAAGREALEAARPFVEAADARILSALGAGKREAFLNALAKLSRAAGEPQLEMVEAPESEEEAKPKKSKKDKAKPGKKAKRADATEVDGDAVEAPFEPARLVAPD